LLAAVPASSMDFLGVFIVIADDADRDLSGFEQTVWVFADIQRGLPTELAS
jgi:hypothetical protein